MLVGRTGWPDFRRIGTDDHQILLMLDRVGDRAFELSPPCVRRFPFGRVAFTAADAATGRKPNRSTSVSQILNTGLF